MDASNIKTHDETHKVDNDEGPVVVKSSVKIEGTSAGTLLGVVSLGVTVHVKKLENKGKITAVSSLDSGDRHHLILSPIEQV